MYWHSSAQQEEEQQEREEREGSPVFWLKDRATENVSNRAHLQTFEWKTLEGFAGHNTERHTHTHFLGWLIPALAWALILFSSALNEIVKCVTVWQGQGQGREEVEAGREIRVARLSHDTHAI